MISNHNIICFSSDWHQDPLSKHHIMSRLSKHNRILWVNSIGLRTPTATVADAGRIFTKLKSFFKKPDQINENLIVVSPIVIPFHNIPFVSILNTLLLKWRIRYYSKKLGISNPIFWTFLPNTGGIINAFREKLSLYYITDDFTKFEGYPSETIEKMENNLIDKADCIIASARELARKKKRNNKKIYVINHGVNHEHFAASLIIKPEQLPVDIKDIPHPVLGFYGELNSWIDLPMIAEAAKKRPRWSFVLIGRAAVEGGNIEYLKKIPNVYLLGQKKYKELPAYCAAFDVALIPMKINDLTICVNPLKLREYLAAGVPVISAPLPEVKEYGDVVSFASTADELIAAFEKIQSQGNKITGPLLSTRVKSENWDSKVEEISAIIEGALTIKNG